MNKHLAVIQRPQLSPLQTMVSVADTQHGDMMVDTNQDVAVTFTAQDGSVLRVKLRPSEQGDPRLYERMSVGLIQRFTIYRVWGLWQDDTLQNEVAAVGYSAFTKQLILLQKATNVVGGVVLRSRPVSVVKYRPFGLRPVLMTITEVSVVV